MGIGQLPIRRFGGQVGYIPLVERIAYTKQAGPVGVLLQLLFYALMMNLHVQAAQQASHCLYMGMKSKREEIHEGN
jgi:hypothetical protein